MYNVLICDDQPDIVNALKIYLTPEGYNLFEAFTGQEALDIVRKNGDKINVPELSQALGCRVVEISALKGDGIMAAAEAAIEAIVKRCTTMIRSFTTAHIASIEKALRNARSMDERMKYADDLWNMAKDEIPGTTPKIWIQEGKKDLDLLIKCGPEQYQKRNRTQNLGIHL